MGRFSKFSNGFFIDKNSESNDNPQPTDRSLIVKSTRTSKPYHWDIDFTTHFTPEHFENIINTLPSYIKKKSGIFIISEGQTDESCDLISLGEDRFNKVYQGINFFSISDFPEYFYSFRVEKGEGIRYIKFNKLDTSKYESLGWMFWGCSRLEYIDISTISAHNINDITDMFTGCQSLKVIDMSGVDLSYADGCNTFENCDSLETIIMRNCPFVTVELIKKSLAEWHLENQVSIIL